MIRVHQIALDPNRRQATYFSKACGTARFAWNWALAEWRNAYRSGGKPNEGALRKQLNAIKREQFPWMLEVSKTAPQEAIKQLGVAFRRFFRKESGYPRFKRKGERDSYQADNGPGTFTCEGQRIRLPVIGWVRMREAVRFEGKLQSATVSRTANRWQVAIAVETEAPAVAGRPESSCGVDLGVKALATLSDGTVVAGPKAHGRQLRKLRRLNRAMARKTEAAKAAMGLAGKPVPKGVRIPASSNRKKAQAQLARQHARIAAIRQDALHKLTTELVRRHTVIGIEDLNVRGLMANDRLARSIADMGFHEFRRQLEYKARLHGSRIVTAPRFFPSSRTCSACGHVLGELLLRTREWDCPACGEHHDRDLNAARNLARLCEPQDPAPAIGCAEAARSASRMGRAEAFQVRGTASSAGTYACGETGSGLCPNAKVKPGSRKQEVSFEPN